MLDPESGLYYYGGRYYDPDLGRFISPDPFVGQPGDPQNLNRYSYVENNPVNYVDPSGYFSFKKLFKKIQKIFTKYVLPVFRIIVGIAQLATGNPMGLFNIASGASSFAKGRDWQLFSRISGFIADAGSTFPTSDTGPPSSGGSPLLGFEDEGGGGPRGGGGESGGIWGWLFDTLGNLAGTVEEVRATAREKKGFPLPTTAILAGSYYMAAKVWPGRPDVAIAPFFTSGFPRVGPGDFPGFTDIRNGTYTILTVQALPMKSAGVFPDVRSGLSSLVDGR